MGLRAYKDDRAKSYPVSIIIKIWGLNETEGYPGGGGILKGD